MGSFAGSSFRKTTPHTQVFGEAAPRKKQLTRMKLGGEVGHCETDSSFFATHVM